LSSDNKLEYFKVNVSDEDQLLKKLVKQEKRRALKRKRPSEDENDEEMLP
jgi:hypothetical protein